jgi:hypothetical protein
MGLLFYAVAYRVIYHLRRRAMTAGCTLDDVIREYPFLAPYFEQVRAMLPEEIEWGESLQWLSGHIEQWEKAARASGQALAISQMREALGLPHEAALAFAIVGTVEEDANFASLFAALEQRAEAQRVSVGLLQELLGAGETTEFWPLVRKLLEAGFLETLNRDAPRPEWSLRIPNVLWNAARGEYPESVFAGARYRRPEALEPLSDLVLSDELRAQLTELAGLVVSGRTRTVVVRGMPGTDRAGVIGALARELNRGLLEIECPASTPISDDRWRLIGPFCTLTHSLPVFSIEAAPGETFEVPGLSGYQGPLGVIIGSDGGIGGVPATHAVTIQLDLESPEQREEIWRRELAEHAPCDQAGELSQIASTFCLPGRYIRQCAGLAIDYAAMSRRHSVTLADVRRAARAINRQVLDTLATRIDGPASWSQLIVRETTGLELKVLEGRCHYRERLAARFHSTVPGGMNRGVRVLLEGPSGTGKTLAARVLATELGLDLYRVELAAVVNKYIGETEKNLSRVLSRAEDLNVILLLDEGDSLMTRRTDVKSSNDRYANLETNYLLQRLEHYTGIVLITTNASQSIDSAFRRRMDSVIKFHLPDAEERWRLWQIHLPPGHAINGEVLEQIALRYQLSGGQIRNACVNAALFAMKRANPTVHSGDLKEAIQAEHRKAGACFIDRSSEEPARNDPLLATFLGGLS